MGKLLKPVGSIKGFWKTRMLSEGGKWQQSVKYVQSLQ